MFFVLDRKRCLVLSACVLVAGLIVGGIIGAIPYKKTFGVGTGDKLTIVIDAGHGYPDGGAVGASGSVECEINLKLSKKLSEIFEGKGIKTVMTRTSDDGVRDKNASGWSKVEDMRIRQKIIKDADAELFLSIHMNHFSSPKVHGLHLFYSENHKEIKPLAEDIQKNMSKLTGAKVTAVRAASKSLFLLKSPPCPSILIECGFLSNPDEEKNLLSDEYLSKLAWTIADSIEKYYKNDKNLTN